MAKYGSVIDTQRIPVKGLTPESAGTAPTSPVNGQLWTDTSVTPKLVKVWDGAAWVPLNIYAGTTSTTYAAGDDARITGAAQKAANLSDLANVATARTNLGLGTAATTNTGTGPTNTILGNDARLSDMRVPTDASVTGGVAGAGVKIAANTITHDNVATANKDGVAATPSLRTLGTGAAQAAAGNDARLSDMRVPTDGSVTGGTAGAGVKIAANTITLANINASATDAAAGTGSLRTLGTSATSAMAGNTTLNNIPLATAAVSLNNQRITGLAAPVAASDAARLADVQAAAAGIDSKPSVRVASAANVAISTGLASGQTVNGVVLATGDRVLLKNQTTATENGVYIVPATGAASRATDEITPNSTWFVEDGTGTADTAWWVTNNGTITLGTTPLVISQFSGTADYTGTTNRITVTGTVIDIAGTYVGQTSIVTLGTVTSGTWRGTAVEVAYGGTGAATAAAARTNLNVSQRGYAADLAALVAGTPLVVTHNLGTQDVSVTFRETATQDYVVIDWTAASATTISVRSDIAYGAGAIRAVVIPVA